MSRRPGPPPKDGSSNRRRNQKKGKRETLYIRSAMDAPEAATLTIHEKMFLAKYFGEANGIASEAARLCGYADPDRACVILKRPAVQAAIKARMDEAAMSIDELLIRTTEVASVDMKDFLSNVNGQWKLDLDKARRLGKMHLIREITWTKWGPRIKLQSAENAREQLFRYHGLYQQQINVIHKHVDMARLSKVPEGLQILARFSAGEIGHEEFFQAAQSLLGEETSAVPSSLPAPVIDGRGLIHEAEDDKDDR